jgi:acetyl-CoA carboxylase biotin carboxyl carrier protein
VAEVRSEMMANVWKVLVSPGDEVGPDDTLAILESMKMEIPVLADNAGRVVSVEVTEGSSVEEGQLIAIIE